MVKLDKFYHTYKFSTLTINFSEVWPKQILDLSKQFNLMVRLENVLKISLQDVLEMSWRRLKDALKTFLQDVLKKSRRRLEDVWPRQIYWSWSRRLEDVLKTFSEDLWVRWIYSFWSRHLEDVFWRIRRRRKTSSRRLQDASLRRMFAGM